MGKGGGWGRGGGVGRVKMACDKKQLPQVRVCLSPSPLHDKGVLSMLSDKSGETKSISRAMLCSSASDCGQLKENLIWILKRGEGEIRMKEKQWTPSTKGELVEGLDKELVCFNVCACVFLWKFLFHEWTIGFPDALSMHLCVRVKKKKTKHKHRLHITKCAQQGWDV